MGSLQTTTLAVITKCPKLTLFSDSGTTKICQNGLFYLFGDTRMSKELKQNHQNQNGYSLGTMAYEKHD